MISKTPMTIDALRSAAPSAFAQGQHPTRTTNRYGFVSTTAIVEALAKEGLVPYSASEARTRQTDKFGYLRHIIRFRNIDQFRLLRKDEVIYEMVLTNSHAGDSKCHLAGGLYRCVCDNQMVVSDRLVLGISVMHTVNMVREILAAASVLALQSGKVMRVVDLWRSIMMNRDEQMLLARHVHAARFPEGTAIEASQMLDVRRPEDRGNDLFTTFNRLQEAAIRGGLHNRPTLGDGTQGRMVTSKEVKGIAESVKLNQKVWSIAEEFAELKAGRVIEQSKALAAAAGK